MGKEHVPLTGQINQLLELVRACDILHQLAMYLKNWFVTPSILR